LLGSKPERNDKLLHQYFSQEPLLKSLLLEYHFYFSLLENLKSDIKTKNAVFYLRHNWRPLLYPQKECTMLRNNLIQPHFLCSGNTPLDAWCAKFEQDAGAYATNGSAPMAVGDLYVIDDLVIQVYISKEMIEKIETIFNSTKEFINLDINGLIKNIFEKNSKVMLIINKNEEAAKQIKNQAFEMFKTKP
jgi:hypothetical protein